MWLFDALGLRCGAAPRTVCLSAAWIACVAEQKGREESGGKSWLHGKLLQDADGGHGKHEVRPYLCIP
jgi:hypothetical protein